MELFEDMVQKYYSAVYNFLLKLSNYNNDVAEELTQDTFLQAYLSAPDFKGKCQLKTWLIQIAKNCFYMNLRKQKHRLVSLDDMPAEPVDATARPLSDSLYEHELVVKANLIIDSMQSPMKDVMLYRIYTDLPYAQIALLLSISENSAKVLFHRGKKILQKKLKENFGYEI